METFLDINQRSLNKRGEELCGDQVRIQRIPDSTIIVLSDGMGTGVKANILATLTSEILINLLRQKVDLEETIRTVLKTLPIDSERRIAYATFTVLTIHHDDLRFEIINFDNPSPIFLSKGKVVELEEKNKKILGKNLRLSEGTLGLEDYLCLFSDGILYASPGKILNMRWDRNQIAKYLCDQFNQQIFYSHNIVNSIIAKTSQLYQEDVGDDATFIGVYVRAKKSLMVFTGPPVDNGFDYVFVDNLLDFDGRKIICGGTTANIVGSYLHASVETDVKTMTEELPATGSLPGIDLVTEGVLTMSAALELIQSCGGVLEKLQPANNGAYLLAREFLIADSILFQVGQSVNPSYQNPLLPKNISVRRYLVEKIAEELTKMNKDVQVDFC
jgi:hypothetical protein